MQPKRLLFVLLKAAFVLLAAACAFAQPRSALSGDAVVPVVFLQTIDAGKVHPGDRVHAITLVDVHLPTGKVARRGTEILGSVTVANAFRYNRTEYAEQLPGVLGISFDTIGTGDKAIHVRMSVRAIADSFAASEATRPLDLDLDPELATIQIGGDRVRPGIREVISTSGDVVGYRRRDGVHVRLAGAERGGFRCFASRTEIAVSIFSADACGAYGFDGNEVSQEAGALVFISARRTPVVPKRSVALLQIGDPL